MIEAVERSNIVIHYPVPRMTRRNGVFPGEVASGARARTLRQAEVVAELVSILEGEVELEDGRPEPHVANRGDVVIDLMRLDYEIVRDAERA